MGFTELPDNRKINIVASIGEDIEKNNEDKMATTTVIAKDTSSPQWMI